MSSRSKVWQLDDLTFGGSNGQEVVLRCHDSDGRKRMVRVCDDPSRTLEALDELVFRALDMRRAAIARKRRFGMGGA